MSQTNTRNKTNYLVLWGGGGWIWEKNRNYSSFLIAVAIQTALQTALKTTVILFKIPIMNTTWQNMGLLSLPWRMAVQPFERRSDNLSVPALRPVDECGLRFLSYVHAYTRKWSCGTCVTHVWCFSHTWKAMPSNIAQSESRGRKSPHGTTCMRTCMSGCSREHRRTACAYTKNTQTGVVRERNSRRRVSQMWLSDRQHGFNGTVDCGT